ncbi:MAG: hypothetical protein QOK39_471 [Acidimicrobiaceae bacterium]|nr:hypothetical protein [Acidimicrobiaceae bacterium]
MPFPSLPGWIRCTGWGKCAPFRRRRQGFSQVSAPEAANACPASMHRRGTCALKTTGATGIQTGSWRRFWVAGDYGVAFDHAPCTRPRVVLKTFAGGRLFGAGYGTAVPWVLALPGWQRTHRDFDELLRDFDAVALDLPGFGAAPAPPGAWTTAEYADHVAPVLDDMGPRVVLVGHSFGGRVATHLAAAHPERIASLVLTGVPLIRATAGRRARAPVALRAAKALRRAGIVPEEQIERLRQKHGSADYRQATGVMRDVLVKAVNETYQEPLAAFPGPIELIWGADDDQAPVAVAEAARAHCAQPPNLVVLEGVGHFVPRDRPDALAAALGRHRQST